MLVYIFESTYLHIMETRRDVFQAIADPTRRQIIGLIAGQPLNVKAIAEKFDVTRQAISLHVRILEECGLVMVKQQGRERYYEAKLEQLNEVHEWTERYRKFWTKNFQSLRKFLEEADPEKNKKQRRKKSSIKK
jgi:DNA-binding transcriptional ArsR family regulator